MHETCVSVRLALTRTDDLALATHAFALLDRRRPLRQSAGAGSGALTPSPTLSPLDCVVTFAHSSRACTRCAYTALHLLLITPPELLSAGETKRSDRARFR